MILLLLLLWWWRWWCLSGRFKVRLNATFKDIVWVKIAGEYLGVATEGASAACLFKLVFDARLAGDRPAAPYFCWFVHDVPA